MWHVTDKQTALKNAAKALQRRNETTERVRAEFTAALLEAREAGATYKEIGKALGMSHVAVMKYFRRQTE